MDLTTVVGVFTGILLVILAIVMRGDTFSYKNLFLFMNLPSAMITFGAAFAATLVNYPVKQVLGVMRIARKVFAEPDEDTSKLLGLFVSLAQKAKREGFLSIESDIKKLDNDFLKRALTLVIDGQDQEFIRSMLETEVNFIQARHQIGQEIFISMGTYTPAFGMVGTIMGLIMMLANLQNQGEIAQGMAVALLTTFYGAMAAYLIFLPIAGKLKRRSEAEIHIKEIIIRGVLLLQSGTTPSIIESNLQAYLEPKLRKFAHITEKAKGV
ncbi:MAG: motility protein A [bacterium]